MSNELNERVAVAMGWHVGYSDHAPGLPYRRVQWRDYEKHCGDTSEVREGARIGRSPGHAFDCERTGRTLNLALANLVVAVSEAKKP